mgnify:FL=1
MAIPGDYPFQIGGVRKISTFEQCHDHFYNNISGFVQHNLIYPHQQEATSKVLHELGVGGEDKKISLAVLPTGTGKTGIAVLLAYCLKSRNVLIITPSETISRQVFIEFGCDFDYEGFVQSRRLVQPDSLKQVIPTHDLILKTAQITRRTCQVADLTIANAHKFGANSAVDIDKLSKDLFDVVIVDEAHHYPAPTWKNIVHHFNKSRIVFLTATPYWKNKYILGDQRPAYELSRSDAVSQGIIREISFLEVGNSFDSDQLRYEKVICCILDTLKRHDQEDTKVRHQAMILCQSKEEAYSVSRQCVEIGGESCCSPFIQGSSRQTLEEYRDGRIRVLAIVGRLLEGFDQKSVSVAAILRNVAPATRVLFSQFVGRAVRKCHKHDPVVATVISHVLHAQRQNFRRLDLLAEEDPADDE